MKGWITIALLGTLLGAGGAAAQQPDTVPKDTVLVETHPEMQGVVLHLENGASVRRVDAGALRGTVILTVRELRPEHLGQLCRVLQSMGHRLMLRNAGTESSRILGFDGSVSGSPGSEELLDRMRSERFRVAGGRRQYFFTIRTDPLLMAVEADIVLPCPRPPEGTD